MVTLENLQASYEGPFYLFDLAALKQRVASLRQQLPAAAGICYAVKANPFLIGGITGWVDRLEICSPGEYEICRRMEVPSEKMVISGVNKPESLIARLVADDSFRGILTVESLWQLETIRRHAEAQGRSVPVLLRLTNGSQFGINESDILEAVSQRDPHLDILGIQFFSGTQKTSVKKLRRELEAMDALIEKLEREYGFPVRELEYGTGFPVAYFDPEGFDEAAFLAEFSALLAGMRTKAKLTLEIGRSIAASCGSYYTRIVDLKTNKKQNYMLIDGGMHQLVYFGQQMAMSTPPFTIVGKEAAPVDAPWTICGSLCSMNDITAKQVPLPKPEIGDILCFRQTGAYCMTEGIALFLSRDLPAVYLKTETGELKQVRAHIETHPFNTPTKI